MHSLHHPDGLVYVKNATQTYKASLTDFASDYGSPLPALPAGERTRFYEHGIIHYTSDGHNQKAAPEGRPWPEGDAIIAALPALLAKQTARQAAQAAQQQQQQQQQTPLSQPAGGSQG